MNNYAEYKLNDTTHWEWHTTFVGQYMQHNYRLYPILDSVFQNNPQIERIVEIGTGAGALTTFLGLWGLKRNIPLLTLDIKPEADRKFLEKLGVKLIVGDEFNEFVRTSIKSFIKERPTLFICDGANKQDELNYWAQYLVPNSIIAAHDLGVEFSVLNIPPPIKLSLIPIIEERWMEMNAQIAIFKINGYRMLQNS